MNYTGTSYRIFTVMNMIVIGLLSLFAFYPYINTLAVALNNGQDSMLGGITFYPRQPTLENFITLLRDQSIIRALIVSVARVLVGTLFALLVQFTAAYALSKRHLVGRSSILIYFVVPMFFGGGLIPTYLLYSQIGLLNSFFVYILPGAFSFFNIIIIRTYLYTLPESLEESAKIDGANEWGILLRVILPLSMPILATIALWTAVTQWNDWTTTLTFVTNPDLYTLQYKLMQLIKESDAIAAMIQKAIQSGQTDVNNQIRVTPDAIRAAQVIVTTIPIIIVYPFLQKYFIKGIMIGSVKE